ncbi:MULTISPECIES: hypothetical protein [Arthrobacter]|uniref:Uncharacterized protein n=1 Tax=Arthrobacter sunyaminii TaxID=2816859 RepID=A0A975S8D0_9MICC|nr:MULTISPECIES: hypothetical protein [Arthrobacter]MBO0906914.1 hypothetical protein [Arthrobacter sunyaminii]QWQ37669.1 hypothetical protein KG104_08145 [Arthrobacter sunyaminii]
MSAVVSTVKIHLNRRTETFVVPLTIAGSVAIISVLTALIFWRSGSQPGSEAWIQGSQSNPGIVYALVGFFCYLGVASVGTTFPFALALGASRRSFVAGTIIWNALTAAYVALILAALNAIEIATNHWFAGFYIFDIYVLGGGDTLRLLPIVFLGVLATLTIGGVFAAAWVRFGALGPQLLAGGVVLILAVAVIILVPQAAAIAAAFHLWWLAAAAIGAVVLSATGTWLLLRPATVR